ncbi:Charged multivesicular body protein 4b [Anthophora quadrimaculata]
MSFFSKVFGGKKEPAPLTTAEAIQRLRETEDMLLKKQDFLETKIELEIQTAKKHGTKNKRAAIQALKRKKRYEKQLQQIDGTLTTIESQREVLECANTNTAVLTNMKNAADALKSVHQHMDVDQVHDMMDDIAEQQDVAKEISDAISNPVSFGNEIDEEELEKELEELEQEQLDKELLGIESTDELPNVPATALPSAPARTPAKAKPAEDEDLKELQSWAS